MTNVSSITVLSISRYYSDEENKAVSRDFRVPEHKILLNADPFDNEWQRHDLWGPDGRIPVDWVSRGSEGRRSDEEWRLDTVRRALDVASPDVVFVHLSNTGGRLGWELVLPCIERELPVFCHTGAGVSTAGAEDLLGTMCSRAEKLARKGIVGKDVAEHARRLVRVGGKARSTLHDYGEHLGAFLATWTVQGGPEEPPSKEAWDVLEFGRLNEGIRPEANELRARLIQPFQALDILLQGYLAVRGREDDKEWQAVRAEGGILRQGSESQKKAFEVTRAERLFRPPGATEDRGWYWFDECASDVVEYTPFESDYDQKVARLIRIAQESGYRQPTLRMLNRRETVDAEEKVQGALRVCWELLRSYYHPDRAEREKSRSLLPDCWCGKLAQEAATKLFFDAHNEFDTATKKIEEFLS
ncbi:MAG TPA: hypothetical protein VLB76_29385 [Thermoanaerobaculia bacterium]|nr:hypothetical protein [Thermoanaerobaculia bacterium]